MNKFEVNFYLLKEPIQAIKVGNDNDDAISKFTGTMDPLPPKNMETRFYYKGDKENQLQSIEFKYVEKDGSKFSYAYVGDYVCKDSTGKTYGCNGKEFERKYALLDRATDCVEGVPKPLPKPLPDDLWVLPKKEDLYLLVRLLAEQETKKHEKATGEFLNSKHEAYALLLEEFLEAKEALGGVKHFLKEMKKKLSYDSDITMESDYSRMYAHAIHAAMELIQLAGLCLKAQKGFTYTAKPKKAVEADEDD